MTPCIVCSGDKVRDFWHMKDAPVLCNALCESEEQALSVPLADIRLGFCEDCSHIYNLAFDPERVCYTAEYENSLHCSPQFQGYVETLVRDLAERYGLRNKTIVELGCGRGDFLRGLCEHGNNRGFGFDPSAPPSSNANPHLSNEPYSSQHRDLAMDLLCSRHCLEHIWHPVQFLKDVLAVVHSRSPEADVFFEVPNGLFTFRDDSIWDVIYEHCSYFTPSSLHQAFVRAGYRVDSVEPRFQDQFLTLYGNTALGDPTSSPKDEPPDVDSFSEKHARQIAEWIRLLAEFRQRGERVVAWGAGSKGTTFCNMLRQETNLRYIVDINPRKHGRFGPGTGQTIIPPSFLRDYQPTHIVIMNPVYSNEIRTMVHDMGLEPTLLFA